MVAATIPSSDDAGSRAIQEILARSYVATSTDGQVSVWSIGDAKLSTASVRDQIPSDGSLSAAATEAVQSSLRVARAQTACAMAELPGLNPQLRALLRGESA